MFFVVGVKMRIPLQFLAGYVIAGSDEYIDGRFYVINGKSKLLPLPQSPKEWKGIFED